MVDAATVSTSQCVSVLHPALYMSSVSPRAKLFKSVKWFSFNLPGRDVRAGEGGKVRDTSGEEMWKKPCNPTTAAGISLSLSSEFELK